MSLWWIIAVVAGIIAYGAVVLWADSRSRRKPVTARCFRCQYGNPDFRCTCQPSCGEPECPGRDLYDDLAVLRDEAAFAAALDALDAEINGENP